MSLSVSHQQSFSLVCTVMCCVRFPFCANLSPQTGQLHGFTLVWTVKCCVRFPFWVNLLPQREQLKGFSPVWHLMCVCKWCFWPNLLPHFEHLNDLLSVIPAISFTGTTFFIVFKSVWDLLISFKSSPLSWATASEDCEVLPWDPNRHLKPNTEFLSISDPSQSCPSASVFTCSAELLAKGSASLFCLWWRCEDSGFSSSSSLFTETWVNGNLVMSSSCSPCNWLLTSWLVQKYCFSSLMCGHSGSSWSRQALHSLCSEQTSSFITNCCWTSAENTETQTHNQVKVNPNFIHLFMLMRWVRVSHGLRIYLWCWVAFAMCDSAVWQTLFCVYN